MDIRCGQKKIYSGTVDVRVFNLELIDVGSCSGYRTNMWTTQPDYGSKGITARKGARPSYKTSQVART